ncbi:hypothetical protein NSK_005887 [Nannochloropsis salina CCMP1776]|uniref:K Homology domain-containing protein n=1 Tax=Nannochloropsis salina CCMP1776 TaxID=1027361 RepID=A0A4D9CU99_9STRA|nr:hypothetical protein NSK_005887 [Nannochloropsis salina CCMP1776]|eukprot:TFJ82812.1 hypothetical protein NSK_005887 [Nannochloropsis salina CCMP1776]
MVEDFQDGQDCRSVNLSEALVDDDSPKESYSTHAPSKKSVDDCHQIRRAPYKVTPGVICSRVLIPQSRVGLAIGRKGGHIREMSATTGAHINVCIQNGKGRDEAYRLIVVTGSITAVCWAVDLLAQKTGLFNGYSNILSRPKEILNHKMDRTPVMDANSSIPEGKDGKGSPRPSEENIIDGATELKNNGDRKCDQIVPLPGIRVLVHSSMAGALLGRAGSTISFIRSQSNARIVLLNEEESAMEGGIVGERVLLIVGIPDYCRRAHLLVLGALNDTNFLAKAQAQQGLPGSIQQDYSKADTTLPYLRRSSKQPKNQMKDHEMSPYAFSPAHMNAMMSYQQQAFSMQLQEQHMLFQQQLWQYYQISPLPNYFENANMVHASIPLTEERYSMESDK